MIGGLLGLLIALLLLVLVAYIVFWLIPLPQPARMIVGAIFAIIALVLVFRYLGLG